jgi:hypothetical protein
MQFVRNALACACKTLRRIVLVKPGTVFAHDDAATFLKEWRDAAHQALPDGAANLLHRPILITAR